MQLTAVASLLALFATGVLSVPSGLEIRNDCPYCPPPKECPTPYPTPCPTPYCPAPPPAPTPYCPAPPPCPTPYCPAPPKCPEPTPPPPCPTPYCPAPPKCPEPTPPPPCPSAYCPPPEKCPEPPKWTPPPTCSGGYNYCKTSDGKYSKDMNKCAPTGGDACCCKAKGILGWGCTSILTGSTFDLGLGDILG